MSLKGSSTLRPDQVIAVSGALGQRFMANITGRLKNVGLSEQYIRWHELKDHDDWFWSGEQIGKWLDSAAYSALTTRDQGLLDRIDELIDRLAQTQEPDGYIGIVRAHRRTPVRGMQLYEWYYVLLGLLTCVELLNNQTALRIAQKLAQFIVKTWGTEPHQFPLAGMFPGNGHEGGEGTLILEPIALLGKLTNDAALIEWCEATVAMWDMWFDQYPQSNHTCGYTQMKRFAAGDIELHEMRQNIHAHTLHMTLLGLAALYEATGKVEYQETVKGCVNRLKDDWIFITGGMSTGERYIDRSFYHPSGDIEVCPQHTWILLLHQMYQWTGEAQYIDEIERDVFNHLLAAQLADGSNWSYMTPLNGRAQEPESPNCCNASGQRILSRLPSYIYGLREGTLAVLLYTESEARFTPPNLPTITLRQKTSYPTDGMIELHVDPETPAQFRLALRIPYYAKSSSISVNGEEPIRDSRAGFLVLDRLWQAGDVVQICLDLIVSCQANADYAAITRGPLVYAQFENAQPDHKWFHWHQNSHPQDTEFLLDPAAGDSVKETPAPEGLVGPALRVKSRVTQRAPMFTSPQKNDDLPNAQVGEVLLLPFMNQGVVRGEYEVFKRYRTEK